MSSTPPEKTNSSFADFANQKITSPKKKSIFDEFLKPEKSHEKSILKPLNKPKSTPINALKKPTVNTPKSTYLNTSIVNNGTPTSSILKNSNSPSVSDKKKRVHFGHQIQEKLFTRDSPIHINQNGKRPIGQLTKMDPNESSPQKIASISEQIVNKICFPETDSAQITQKSSLKNQLIPLACLENNLEIVKSFEAKRDLEIAKKEESHQNLQKPFMPELCALKDPVKNICNKLAVKGSTSLHLRLRNMNILTVGDFASLSEAQLNSLPIRLPGKVERAKRELTQFYANLFQPQPPLALYSSPKKPCCFDVQTQSKLLPNGFPISEDVAIETTPGISTATTSRMSLETEDAIEPPEDVLIVAEYSSSDDLNEVPISDIPMDENLDEDMEKKQSEQNNNNNNDYDVEEDLKTNLRISTSESDSSKNPIVESIMNLEKGDEIGEEIQILEVEKVPTTSTNNEEISTNNKTQIIVDDANKENDEKIVELFSNETSRIEQNSIVVEEMPLLNASMNNNETVEKLYNNTEIAVNKIEEVCATLNELRKSKKIDRKVCFKMYKRFANATQNLLQSLNEIEFSDDDDD